MTIDLLKGKLQACGIPENMYSLDGGLPNEAICLYNNAGIWSVYYSEHGEKTGVSCFQKESEACEYFYIKVIKVAMEMGLVQHI